MRVGMGDDGDGRDSKCGTSEEVLSYESPLGVRSFTLTSGASDFPSKVVRSKVYENTS